MIQGRDPQIALTRVLAKWHRDANFEIFRFEFLEMLARIKVSKMVAFNDSEYKMDLRREFMFRNISCRIPFFPCNFNSSSTLPKSRFEAEERGYPVLIGRGTAK